MKRTIALSLCLSFLTIFASHAQDKSTEFGVKAGLNIANIVAYSNPIPDLMEFTSISYLHVGVFYNHYVDEHWALGAELLYNQKGGTSNPEFESNQPVTKFRFDYLSLPLLLSYHIEGFGLEVGPQISYQFNVTGKSDPPINDKVLEFIWGKEIEVAALVGLSYRINKFHFGLRYDFGLTSLTEFTYTDLNGEPIGDEVKHWNRVLQFSLGYALF